MGGSTLLITSHTGGETSLYEERLVDNLVENNARWDEARTSARRLATRACTDR